MTYLLSERRTYQEHIPRVESSSHSLPLLAAGICEPIDGFAPGIASVTGQRKIVAMMRATVRAPTQMFQRGGVSRHLSR